MMTDKTLRAYSTLLVLLFLLAGGSILMTSMLVTSTDTAKMAIVFEQGTQAKALADSCTEMALLDIRHGLRSMGDGSSDIDGGHCEYTFQKEGDRDHWVIQSLGKYGDTTNRQGKDYFHH